MTENKEPIKVPTSIAEVYRDASPEKRKRAERAMATALMSGERAGKMFRNITERASEYAAGQGLTTEKLDELLGEDKKKASGKDPYSWLKILREAKLSGPKDASVTYNKQIKYKT